MAITENTKPNRAQKIDFTIDGIGESTRPAPAPVKGSKIDIPLGGAAPVTPKADEADITLTELAFVNRHHEEAKAKRRAARSEGE